MGDVSSFSIYRPYWGSIVGACYVACTLLYAGFLSIRCTGICILGRGADRIYPLGRLPTHPFRVFGIAARGKKRGELCMWRYQGRTSCWWRPSKCLVKYSARFSWPGCHCTSKYPCLTWSVVQKNRISIDQERCFLKVSFAMPTAVRLSQWLVVGGCACPNSSRIVQSILRSFALRKRAPISASAAEVTTNFRIPLWTYIAPLIGVCSPFLVMGPRK